jgi:hypothetical protein
MTEGTLKPCVRPSRACVGWTVPSHPELEWTGLGGGAAVIAGVPAVPLSQACWPLGADPRKRLDQAAPTRSHRVLTPTLQTQVDSELSTCSQMNPPPLQSAAAAAAASHTYPGPSESGTPQSPHSSSDRPHRLQRGPTTGPQAQGPLQMDYWDTIQYKSALCMPR